MGQYPLLRRGLSSPEIARIKSMAVRTTKVRIIAEDVIRTTLTELGPMVGALAEEDGFVNQIVQDFMRLAPVQAVINGKDKG